MIDQILQQTLISFYSFDSILIQTFKNNNIAEHLDFYSIPILHSINYNINFIKNLIIEALLQLLIPINPGIRVPSRNLQEKQSGRWNIDTMTD